MDTVQEHKHSFAPESWPFSLPVNTAAFTSAGVISGQPVLRVFHDHDGDWQFHSADDDSEARIICLGCAYDRDRSLAILADLPVGWVAYRDAVDQSWQCEPYEDSDADESSAH